MREIVNRKAYFNYRPIEKFESGIVFTGNEIKSVRSGKVSLGEAYVFIRGGEAFLVGAHIGLYEKGVGEQDTRRDRKLLLQKKEIEYLAGRVAGANLTIVPLRLIFRRNFAKIEIALAAGKKKADKREDIKRKEAEREAQKYLRKEKLAFQRTGDREP